MKPTAIPFLALVFFAYYLFARAAITKWLWSRFPKWLDTMATCTACSGFWIGLAVSFYLEPPYYPEHYAARWIWGAIWGLVANPLVSVVILAAIKHSAAPPAEEPLEEPPMSMQPGQE